MPRPIKTDYNGGHWEAIERRVGPGRGIQNREFGFPRGPSRGSDIHPVRTERRVLDKGLGYRHPGFPPYPKRASDGGVVSQGTKYDGDKPMADLLDADFLLGVAKVLTFGAKKYAAHNWRKGIKVSRIIAACLRHLFAIMKGEDLDKETGYHHAYHLGCEVMFLASMLTTRKDMDDRWKPLALGSQEATS